MANAHQPDDAVTRSPPVLKAARAAPDYDEPERAPEHDWPKGAPEHDWPKGAPDYDESEGARRHPAHLPFGSGLEREPALNQACRTGQVETAASLLANGADPNEQTGAGVLPLFDAARNGHTEIVALLLEHRADVNLADSEGNTALMAAAESGNTEVAKMLLGHGADAEAKNEVWLVASLFRSTALVLACCGGHTELAALLVDHGANVNTVGQDNCTALHFASLLGHEQTARWLLDHGAEVDVKGSSDLLTAFHVACKKGNTAMAKLLLDHGADVNTCARDGHPAMVHACASGCVELVALLLDRGVNKDCEYGFLNLAIQKAIHGDHFEVLALMLSEEAALDPSLESFSKDLVNAPGHIPAQIVQRLIACGARVPGKSAQEARDGPATVEQVDQALERLQRWRRRRALVHWQSTKCD
ncbi:hypothetical protein FNF31_01135 [Cafeteria roenbergensis]|uniref:Uncharacterized protein n=1 Tax=Cafeteria roenbergensis TaxID=33653 RepID=A0A5A8DSD6_CAFRO|nr:hypothetical protein FNF31_01135 [Cafeteria roenbergensis]